TLYALFQLDEVRLLEVATASLHVGLQRHQIVPSTSRLGERVQHHAMLGHNPLPLSRAAEQFPPGFHVARPSQIPRRRKGAGELALSEVSLCRLMGSTPCSPMPAV